MIKSAGLLLTVSAMSIGATPVFAQAANEGASAANDIIVTARRTEERLQDVPISITVFDQEALSDRNISDAQDLVNYTPSLSTNARFGNENATYALRGFSQETGTAPAVGVYFAEVVAPRGFAQGIPAGDGAGPGSFFDLQNVQVLSGPQGTLFGRNTTGGAVLLVPQKPTSVFEGYLEGSVGNYDMRRLQGVVNFPIGETIRTRFGLDHMEREGYLINDSGIGPRAFNDVDYLAFRASVVADITPDLENYTIFSISDSKNNGTLQKISDCYPNVHPSVALFMSQACGTLAETDARGFYHTLSTMPDPVSKLKQWQAINTTTWRMTDNVTVKNIISYARLKNRMNTPLYGTQFYYPTGDFMGNVPVDYVQVRTFPGAWLADQSTFTEELQFQGTSMNRALTWQFGGYYEDSRPRSLIGSQPLSFITCSDPDNLQCIDISALSGPPAGAVIPNLAKTYFRSKALYAQATYDVSDQLAVTGGIRYTWDKMWALGRQYAYTWPGSGLFGDGPALSCTRPELPSSPASPEECDIRLSKKSSAPTWLLGLDYKPNPDVLLYAKYSRGYRTGGVKTDVPGEYDTWDAEKVDTYEVGAKTSFGGAVRGRFNIAAFYNDFSNQQINYGYLDNPAVPGAIAPGAGPINVGKSRIWGIETDARVEPFDGLALNAAYTYLNTRVKAVDPISLPPTHPYIVEGEILAGYKLPFTPEHKLSLGATYTLPLDETLGEVSLGVNYTYTSSQIASYGLRSEALIAYFGGDRGVLGSRNLLDLYFNWRNVAGGPIDLGVFATDVTNEEYYTSVSAYAEVLGFNTGNVGQPRMYGVRAKINFGE